MIPFSCFDMFQGVATSFPSFRKLFDEHISEYGELNPHVLAGDLSAFISDMTAKSEDFQMAAELLDVVGRFGCDGSEELKNVISVSIVENLVGRGMRRVFRYAKNDWLLDVYSRVAH